MIRESFYEQSNNCHNAKLNLIIFLRKQKQHTYIYIIMVDYLSWRSQFVIVNENRNDIAKIVTGVIQGSVLGPFLFLVWINDFAQTFQSDKGNALSHPF